MTHNIIKTNFYERISGKFELPRCKAFSYLECVFYQTSSKKISDTYLYGFLIHIFDFEHSQSISI